MIVNERIISYLNSLNQDIPKELLELENEAIMNNIPIIKKDTQEFLRYLLKVNRPKRILEIGTAIGYSALFMSEFSDKDTQITTIEKSVKRYIEAEKNFANDKFSNRFKIKLMKEDAFKTLEDLVNQGMKYDFIFLDAAKAQYLYFLPYLLKLLNERAILLTDNVLQDGTVTQSRYSISRRDRTIHARMRAYLYEIKNTKELETVIVPIGDGIAISNKI